MRKKKIAFSLWDFHIGGIESILYSIAERLNKEFDFYFLATASPEFLEKFKSVGECVYSPGLDNLTKNLQKIQPDILQVHNQQEQIDAGIAAGVKNIIERTDGTRSCARLSKSNLSCVIASNKGTLPLIEKVSPKGLPIHLIYNGVDLDLIDSKKPLQKSSDKFVLGRSTRFGAGKNIPLLIEAVKKLSKSYSDLELHLIGGDSVLPNAEKNFERYKKSTEGYEDNIKFLGYQEDIIPLTHNFTIGTCVSRPNNEGIPNSLMESMACGKPVISTQVDQIDELVNDQNGILIPDNHLEELTSAIEYLYQNREILEARGVQARRTIEERFNLERTVVEYKKVYENYL